jgi:lipopolysaccharide transport system permease protein
MKTKEENWSLIVKPNQSVFHFDYKALWRFRDLLLLFVRRDFVSVYKQTILGPLWFLIQPILTTVTYIITFGYIAGISTNGLPPMLFYLSGIVFWNYFSENLTKTSETFTANAGIFGKVYFPRLIVPISIIVSNLVRFGIQFLLFAIIWVYFYVKGTAITVQSTAFLFPFLIVLMAGYGLAFGIIISSLTTKYRDLKFLVQFGVQLLMFATPVVYPLSKVPEKYHWILLMNPMTSIIETFKHGFLGIGVYDPIYLVFNFIAMIFILMIALLLFNKIEKSFMDMV